MGEQISPTELWKQIHDKYFWEVEDCDKDNPTDVLFFHLPHFSRSNGLWWLIFIALVTVTLSGYLYKNYELSASSGGWMSSLLLNVAVGVIAGFILCMYTTRRDRVVMGFSEVSAIMKRRLHLFRWLFGNDGEMTKIDPVFILQTNDDTLFVIDSLSANTEFNTTLIDYFKYLQKYFGCVFSGFDFAKVVTRLDDCNSSAFTKIEELRDPFTEEKKEEKKIDNEKKIDRDKKKDKTLLKECCLEVRKITQHIICNLEELYYQLQTSLYGVKLGNARHTSWREKCNKKRGRGGVINDEILRDGSQWGVFAPSNQRTEGMSDGKETSET